MLDASASEVGVAGASASGVGVAGASASEEDAVASVSEAAYLSTMFLHQYGRSRIYILCLKLVEIKKTKDGSNDSYFRKVTF